MVKECDVCDGDGDYPITDRHGTQRYTVTCPHCHGSGEEDGDEELTEPSDLPPASTAASIRSMEHLREHIKQHWSDKKDEKNN